MQAKATHHTWVASAALFFALAAAASAQTTEPASQPEVAGAFRTKFDREVPAREPVLICTRVERPPTLDGEVDKDPVWQSCGRTAGAWTQMATKQVSGRQTVAYSCFDKENLYFGFVCEEPELNNVRMDGALTQAFQPAGPDDSVEAIIEIGGVQGEGEVYSFRANLRSRIAAWGATSILTEWGQHMPVWKSAGKFGPNRWMLEMAIPFATLKRYADQTPMFAKRSPSRGYVLGLKLVRWGAQQEDAKNRMISTWNSDIAFPTPYIAGSNGLLYMEDANSIRDGSFAQTPEQSPWKRQGQIDKAGRGLSLDKGASLVQSVDVLPNSYYRFSVAGEGPMELLADGKGVTLNNGQGGFWSGEHQEKVVVSLQASGPAKVKEVLMQYQPGEKPPGPYCLTNNYRHAERNIRARLPEAAEGKYQYVLLDYQNRVGGDDNPSIRNGAENSWAYDYNLRVEDMGGKSGWIAFGKGSLTGSPTSIFWQTSNPSDYACWGRSPRAVQVDLGQEYWVRSLDVLLPGPIITNLEVWGKLRAEDPWTLLHVDDGQFVNPAKRRRDRRAYESVGDLDSVVRFLMWRTTPPTGGHDLPEMDGIQEFWVWGEFKGSHSGIKPFAAWVPDEKVPPKKAITTAPDPEACLIYPRPRKMTAEPGWFVIGPRTRIVAQGDAEARRVAGQIRDEIRQRWQIVLPMEEEPADAAGLDDMIYVGQPRRGPMAEQLRKAEGLEIRPNSPQAYSLRASRQRAVVLGADDDGLYWAVQSLMLAMRWHSSKDSKQNGLGVRCIKVEDWPATLDRTVFFTEGTLFGAIEPEIPRILDNAHLQTRFKLNATYSALSEPPLPWAPGRVAEVCRQIRNQYHMEVRPMLMTPPAYYLGGWNKIVAAAKDFSVVERDPDEAPEDLGAALNLCPLNPRTYSLINERIDELIEQYGSPSKIWMGGLVNHAPVEGSRWVACRECLKSDKSKDELFVCFADKIAQHLQERHVTGVVEPHAVAFGDRTDPKWKRAIVAADVLRLPRDFEYILPPGFAPAKCAALQGRISPSQTADGATEWPSRERMFRGPMGSDIGTMGKLGETWHLAGMVATVEQMWYGPDSPPAGAIDYVDLNVFANCWHFQRDLPSWRAGDRPTFFPIDLRPFVNHTGNPTGTETLEAGRVQEVDLRYVPKGKQVLSGVEFDLIDPAANQGKNILMLGRPIPGATHPKDAASVVESAGPIAVGRKLASLAFLTAGWQASTQDFQRHHKWLLPTCRVIYDDDTWLVADCFRVFSEWDTWNKTENLTVAGCPNLLERTGWLGNCPTGSPVRLKVEEWVNPYPEKTVKCLQFVTPDYEGGDGAKRTNPECMGIIALSGVEPIEQDLSYWSKRTDRLPLLPPVKPARNGGTAFPRAGDPGRTGDKFTFRMKGASGEVGSTLELTPGTVYGTDYVARGDCGYVACNTEYKPFGAVQTFDPPARLSRIEVRGPSYGVDHEYSLGRTHRLDVAVEISEDGLKWRQVGELKGISGDADFLPVEFDPTTVKKIRFTATAGPYHREYSPSMANPIAGPDYPYFVWRLVAPTGSPASSKP